MNTGFPSSREQFEAILSHIADGVAVQYPDASIVYLNPAAAQIMGFNSPEEALRIGIDLERDMELFDENEKPLSLDLLPGRQALRGVKTPTRVVRVTFRNDPKRQTRWAWVKASPVYTPDGRLDYVVNVFQEITHLKQAELGLRDANQRVTNILEEVLATCEIGLPRPRPTTPDEQLNS
jgi:PAS domain S-box-containing protein